MALFDPRVDVIAVTATAGNVSAAQATRNVQAIVEQLDPPRFPRIGSATPCEQAASHAHHIHGEDGLGNSEFAVSQLHHQHLSDKIICDEVRAAPEQVTILCLGPLTNLARAFQRDPELPGLVGRVVISGGSVEVGGNVTAAAEFNMYYDPMSARKILRSRTTKTMVPLDVTRQVNLSMGFLEDLPSEETGAGKFLRKVLPFLFRSYHLELAQESICLPDAVAYLAAVQPELFSMAEMSGDIETMGELTVGATVFDRRPKNHARSDLEVAREVDVSGAIDSIIRGLSHAGRNTV